MANALYGKGRNKFARGEIHWTASGGDTIRVCFLKSTYSPQIDTHEFFSDLGTNVVGNNNGSTRASCPQLTLYDPVLGVCDADDVTFTGITSASGQLNYICIFKDTGSDSTSPLLVLIDTATGLPFTGSGADVQIQWDNGSNKIFKL